jgi:anti-sigma factor (TIGR02949 family)
VISCDEAVDRLWGYLQDDLDAGDRERVQAHLALCRRCCGEAEFTDALRGLLGSTTGPAVPEEAEEHLLGFLDSLETEVP